MDYHITRKLKIVLIIMFVLINLMFSIVFGISSNAKKIVYVDDDANPSWYDETHVKTIREGINNATNGDTVYVYNGTYYENITLTKSLSLIGEQQQTTIIDGCQLGNVLTIVTNNTLVSGFTIQNTSNDIWEYWAIKIQEYVHESPHLKNITISQCIITGNKGGLLLRNVTDCRILNCSVYNNSRSSLVIRSQSGNILIDNSTFYLNGEKIDDNAFYAGGVIINTYDELCTNLTMTNCLIYNNIGCGLEVSGVHHMSIERSSIQENSWFGIYLGQMGENITIKQCKVCDNKRGGGIYIVDGVLKGGLLRSIRNILLNNNTIENNEEGGILVYNCINSIYIVNNTIISNNGSGVYFVTSRSNKVFHNNFINNTCHAFFSHFAFWNNWGGNYWDNWIGVGPKIIKGRLRGPILPWYNFDWYPVKNPYGFS